MIKTNKWSNQELLKYILSDSNSSRIQPEEAKQLQNLPAFSKEGVAKEYSTRFKISELYEPLDAYRSLGLPIIDWKGKDGRIKWNRGSKEGIPNVVWSHPGY